MTTRGIHDLRDVYRVAVKATEAGAERKSLVRLSWDTSGRCECPVHFVMQGGNRANMFARAGRTKTFIVEGDARCRRCGPCMKARARLWTERAIAETRAAKRTWFGTLTMNGEHHWRYLVAARLRCAKSFVDYDAQDAEDRIVDLIREYGPDLCRWVKRVRKQSAAPLRYLMVTELHQSGLPHFHCLIHEMDHDLPVRKAVLREQWIYGFSRWKLVEDGEGAVRYCCKYLAKQALGRVRASLAYGVPHSLNDEGVETISRHRVINNYPVINNYDHKPLIEDLANKEMPE